MVTRPTAQPRRRLLLPVLLALSLVPAAPAAADGDPASDVLLAQDVFRPYDPRVSAPVARALDRVVGDARRAGWPVKVALIARSSDLGAYPQLFGEPQTYADLLGVELSFNRKPRILTVMPSGFGTRELGPGAARVLAGVTIDAGARSDGLALAAARAVAALATVEGHPVALGTLPPPSLAPASGSGSGPLSALAYVAPILVLGLVGGVAGAVGRRRRSRPPTGPADEPSAVEPRSRA